MPATGKESPLLDDAELARFWSKVGKTAGCWEWSGARFSNGYGAVKIRGSMYKAHRIAFALANPEVKTAGFEICHTCDNPPCLNPDHLFLGDALVNAKDRNDKMRHVHGARCHTAKISDADVARIRDLAKTVKTAEIASLYGLSPGHLRKIIRGSSWFHIAKA